MKLGVAAVVACSTGSPASPKAPAETAVAEAGAPLTYYKDVKPILDAKCTMCHYAGGIVAPVNSALPIRDLLQQIERSDARGLVVHPDCLPVALKAAQIANIPTARTLALRFDQQLPTNDAVSTVGQFIANAKVAPDMIRYRPSIDPRRDTAFLVYSSGTTGHPKGVMVSHQNVVADVFLQSLVESAHVDWRRDRTLAVLPIYHIYGELYRIIRS